MTRAILCLSYIIIQSSVLTAQEYFQQEVNYKIKVVLDDSEGVLRASESIEYINRSPDSLCFIYFHLWPNAYSGNTTDLAKQLFRINGRQKLFNDPRKRGWIDSLNFTVNSIPVKYEELPAQPDICKIILPSVLAPGDTIFIKTPFRVKIPQGNISRMGINDDVFQISQWYPKPAVYDKEGWHPLPYLDQGEFYSEFGRFDVEITVPEDYVVAASGELLTSRETDWLANVASEWRFQEPGHDGKIVMKTLNYSEDHIHDFAWVASRNFKVMTRKIILPVSGREITARVMFTTSQTLLWENALDYVSRSIQRFSDMIGDYPYGSFTAVQTSIAAGLGMEYPGLAVIGNAEDAYSLDEVIAHEICHNWFYSSLGSDERRYPFMDESIVSAYEQRYMNIYHPDKKLWELYFRNAKMARLMGIDKLPAERLSEIQWLITARNNLEQPLDLPAPDYTDRNYSDMIYFKAAKGFNYLRGFLGDNLFDSIMQEYYSQWKGRHPSPDDLYNIFREKSGKEVSWFFSDFLETVKRYNYKVKRVEGDSILVKNTREMISPLNLGVYRNDTLLSNRWIEGFRGSKWIQYVPADIDEIRLSPLHLVPELSYSDNNIKMHGLFRKSDPIAPQFISSIEDPSRKTLVLMPLLNWNRADGFMAGIALNNGSMLPKPVEFVFRPFYTFRVPDLSGQGRVDFNLTPYNSIVRKLTLSLEGERFGAIDNINYVILKPGIDVWFRNRNMLNSTSHHVSGRFIHATDIQTIAKDLQTGTSNFWQAGYSFSMSGPLNPFDISGTYEWNRSYGKVFMELNYRISYNMKNKGFDIRLFSGTMTKVNAFSDIYSFAPSGRSGKELYLFEGDFPDRFSDFAINFWSRQMQITEGSLVSPVNDSTGYSRSVISLSLSGNLPGFAGYLPVKPFADMVYASGKRNPFYEAGIKAGIWNVFEVYMPFIVSGNISSIRPTVKERIRFTLNLESILKIRI